MSTAANVLLIIVSCALSIFLVVGVFVLIKLGQLIKSLKQLAERAEKIADSAEAVSDFFHKSPSLNALGRLFANLSEAVFNNQKRRKE
jgi:nitrate/nitrite-specific signal transduction histidine kinase